MEKNNFRIHRILNNSINTFYLLVLLNYIFINNTNQIVNYLGSLFYLSFFIYYLASFTLFNIYFKKIYFDKNNLPFKTPDFPSYTRITKNIMLAFINIMIITKMDIKINNIYIIIYIIILLSSIGITLVFLEKIIILIVGRE
jgi:hypothetical protein